MTRHLLIDSDPGIDDALAILLALRSSDARVEAVTTVAGNVSVDRATANARRILAVAAPDPPPPLAGGAPAPLKRALVTAHQVHGHDGLGNLERFVEPSGHPRYPEPTYTIEMRSGPEVILDAADRWGAELTIVALGPLTNLALALQEDPAAARPGRPHRGHGRRDRGARQHHAGRRVQLLRGSGGGRGRARGGAAGGAGAAGRDAAGGARRRRP